jgi:hypothetical protein
MTAKLLFEAEVDGDRNLLRTRYSGRPMKADFEAGAVGIKEALLQMKPGFTILADWSKFEGMEIDCVPYIAEIMDLARTQGAALVVRVLPDPAKDIGINILSVVHLRGTARTVTADNLEEAERLIG